MFSLVLRAPASLGSELVFVQYLIALAAVHGLEQTLGIQGAKLGLCIKWPNDIYADLGPAAGSVRFQKIGGILVNNSFSQGSFTLVVGKSLFLTLKTVLKRLTLDFRMRHQLVEPSSNALGKQSR